MALNLPLYQPQLREIAPPQPGTDFTESAAKGYQFGRILIGVPQMVDQLKIAQMQQELAQNEQLLPLKIAEFQTKQGNVPFERAKLVSDILASRGAVGGVDTGPRVPVGDSAMNKTLRFAAPEGQGQVPEDTIPMDLPGYPGVGISPSRSAELSRLKLTSPFERLMLSDRLQRERFNEQEEARRTRPKMQLLYSPDGRLANVPIGPGEQAPEGFTMPSNLRTFLDPLTGTFYSLDSGSRRAYTYKWGGQPQEIDMSQVPQEGLQELAPQQEGQTPSAKPAGFPGGTGKMPESVIDDFNNSYDTLGLLREMGPFIQQGKGGLEGAANWIAAMTGQDPAGVDFDAARDQMKLSAQALIKGIPSDRDAKLLTNTLPSFWKADARNKARFDIAVRIAQNSIKNRIAYLKGNGVRIPEELLDTARNYGIDVDGVQGASFWKEGNAPYRLTDEEREAFIKGTPYKAPSAPQPGTKDKVEQNIKEKVRTIEF